MFPLLFGGFLGLEKIMYHLCLKALVIILIINFTMKFQTAFLCTLFKLQEITPNIEHLLCNSLYLSVCLFDVNLRKEKG